MGFVGEHDVSMCVRLGVDAGLTCDKSVSSGDSLLTIKRTDALLPKL